MPADIQPAKIPVILLYSVDPDWTQVEKDEVIHLTTQLGDALIDMGHPWFLFLLRTMILPAALVVLIPPVILFLTGAKDFPESSTVNGSWQKGLRCSDLPSPALIRKRWPWHRINTG